MYICCHVSEENLLWTVRCVCVFDRWQVHVLAMLDHPNIIGYYDSFEEDGIMMIEMEYADGG